MLEESRTVKRPIQIQGVASQNEIQRLLTAAKDPVWKAKIILSKTASLRRGEVLNLTVNDIDFDKGKVIVQPKPDTDSTWRWVVKDKERRELPLIDSLAQLLADIIAGLPEGQPYLFLTTERYEHLLKLKKSEKLIDRVAKCPEANFRRDWKLICKRAAVEGVTFHDLRATCITEWFEQGMMPHEVQRLAGHSSIDTTMNYYVGIRESMIGRARVASSAALNDKKWCRLVQGPKNGQKSENDDVVLAMQTLVKAGVIKIGATGLEPATS